MPRVINLPKAKKQNGIETLRLFIASRLSKDEIVRNNNNQLLKKMLYKGKNHETSKAYDKQFNQPIDLPSYEIEKLINK